jgi:group I intron endonuclease
MTGIYKMTHITTGKYYIGSSVNVESRHRTHLSFFKSGKNHKKLQELYNQHPEFEFIVLEECKTCDLQKKEEKYLKTLVGIDPLCVNHTTSGHAITRGRKKSSLHKEHLAYSMVGKNGKLTRKVAVAVIVSPTGEEFPVVNIKQFALQRGLQQTSLNSVVTGKQKHHKGWTLKGNPITNRSRSLPVEMKPDIKIVSPDGTIHITKNISDFETINSIKVITPRSNSKLKITQRQTTGVDERGRGWYVAGVKAYTFKNRNTGEVIENVISHSTLANYLGNDPTVLRRMINNLEQGIPIQKRKHGWYVERYIVQEK